MAAYLKTIDTAALANLSRVLVGVDRILNSKTYNVNTSSNYPPHNIAKYSETSYGIEVAVAGFGEGDIEINLEDNVLTITGTKVEHADPDNYEYLHRGLSRRSFNQTFRLAPYVEVVNASNQNGILTIYLERKLPEEKKPKKIAINYNK